MGKGITVKTLLEACRKEVEKGNGSKVILISSDDEGNEYHTLWHLFMDDPAEIKTVQNLFHENHNVNNVVILG